MTDNPTHTPLPCPFCNGQANTEIRHSRIDGVKDRHFPSCLNGDCPAFIVDPYVTYSTKREALTAWNTRAVNSHHDLIEALEALLNSSGARGVYHASKHFDAVEAAESLLAALKEAGHG